MNSQPITNNLNITGVKKIFQNINMEENGIDSKVNFITNDYTIWDIEICKNKLKRKLNNIAGSNVLKNSDYVNKASEILIKNLMNKKENSVIPNPGTLNSNNDVNDVFLKSYQKDGLNKLEINSYDHIINIDTNFIEFNEKNINSSTNDYSKIKNNLIVNLSEKLENIVELKLNTIQIPYTFYNICSSKNNNFFYLYKFNTSGNQIIDEKIEIQDGLYENFTDLITEIQDKINNIDGSNELTISYNNIQKKIGFENSGLSKYVLHFYETNNKSFVNENMCNIMNNQLQTNLGWVLGSRNMNTVIESYNNPSSNINYYSLEETVESNTSIILNSVAFIPFPKYFMLCIEDYSKNQHDKTLVQIDNYTNLLKPKIYPIDDKSNNMNCVTCDNINNLNNYTKAQKYSQMELLKQKQNNKNKNMLNSNLNIDQLLAIIPFDSSNTNYEFGHLITIKKDSYIKNNRKYFGPVSLEKLKFTLYDNNGYIIDFNGNDWNFTLLSSQLYKY